MDSNSIALEMPMIVDVEAPRRGLTAMLSLATLTVWSFVFVATAQAFVA